MAFVFCGLGDLFLELRKFDSDRNTLHFILGIASFMIAQMTFAYLFSQRVGPGGKVVYSTWTILAWIPFLLLMCPVMIIILIGGKLNYMMITPVFLYATAISTMGWRALVKSREKYGSIRLIGSVVFIFSDSCIALDTFTDLRTKLKIPVTFVGFVIMFTYWIALYCFTYSFASYSEDLIEPESTIQ
jgi:uncharacterized membrane protein YhhN